MCSILCCATDSNDPDDQSQIFLNWVGKTFLLLAENARGVDGAASKHFGFHSDYWGLVHGTCWWEEQRHRSSQLPGGISTKHLVSKRFSFTWLCTEEEDTYCAVPECRYGFGRIVQPLEGKTSCFVIRTSSFNCYGVLSYVDLMSSI